MKNLFKNFLSILTSSAVAVPYLCCVSCGSNGDEPISTFTFSLKQSYIMPGQTLIAVSEGSGKSIDNCDVDWTLLNAPTDIVHITDDGILSVDDIIVDVPSSFQLLGTLKSDSSLSYTLNLSLVPKTDSNFLGFLDNKIDYVNRSSNLESINLEKSDENTYVNSTPINLFTSDFLPAQYSSWINFIPIIRDDCEPEMHFRYGSGSDEHSIRWVNYNNGQLTTTIPMFNTISFNVPVDYIEVTFECDQAIKLILELNIWTRKDLLTPGVFDYEPSSADDPNYVTPYIDREDGAFYSNIRCKVDDEMYHGSFPWIYCYRKPHEFLDYDIQITNINQDLYNDAFGFDKEPTYSKYVRKLDNYPYYIISFDYWIDGSKVAEYRWKRVPLFTIEASDKLHGSLACYCDFVIEWYE